MSIVHQVGPRAVYIDAELTVTVTTINVRLNLKGFDGVRSGKHLPTCLQGCVGFFQTGSEVTGNSVRGRSSYLRFNQIVQGRGVLNGGHNLRDFSGVDFPRDPFHHGVQGAGGREVHLLTRQHQCSQIFCDHVVRRDIAFGGQRDHGHNLRCRLLRLQRQDVIGIG